MLHTILSQPCRCLSEHHDSARTRRIVLNRTHTLDLYINEFLHFSEEFRIGDYFECAFLDFLLMKANNLFNKSQHPWLHKSLEVFEVFLVILILIDSTDIYLHKNGEQAKEIVFAADFAAILLRREYLMPSSDLVAQHLERYGVDSLSGVVVRPGCHHAHHALREHSVAFHQLNPHLFPVPERVDQKEFRQQLGRLVIGKDLTDFGDKDCPRNTT